jgi:hypothetical protein
MKKRNLLLLGLTITGLTMISCKKADDGEVLDNTFTGNVAVTSTGTNPAGDFTGNGDSGTYQFAWDNSKTKAQVNFDITSSSGSVTMMLQDKKDAEVLNQTLTAGGSEDTFSGVSGAGKEGIWTVTITLTDFNGDGSYSLSPMD